ncbi:hypothetical protein [uncultured Aquimarina sp.]|uniref:hypothetical protein n=1 Tax=uncultured Aquimarina sp. TaxID=575652 RepID=UPI0026094F15|nr:hypothetical protein [uncultured Aquimarina sp.]
MNKIYIKRIVFVLTLLGFTISSFGQGPEDEENTPPYHQVLPASPTAASLGKYGEYKVGGSTGVPGIAVPLFEVNGNTMSVPVSLSYHGSGNKVTDVASWVGMGWSLNAGGVIARTVIGNEDEAGAALKAFYSQGFDPDNFDPNYNQADFNLFRALTKQGWTADPDIYSFNVMGYSGQFFIDLEGNVRLYSLQDLEIEYVSGLGQIDRFIITTGTGTVFEFAEKETTYNNSSSNCGIGFESASNLVSAWYLTKINSEYEEFTFTYEQERILHSLSRSESQSFRISLGNGPGGLSDCYNLNILEIYKKKLKSITGPFGTASFTSNKNRLDLNGGKALQTISYQDIDVKLNTSFMTSNENGWNTNDNMDKSRLILNSVNVQAGLEDPKNYSFNYESTILPPRDSYSMDHYGYFNGKNNSIPMPKAPNFSEGANRDVVPTLAKAGILEEIIYPTGGKTIFEWESNQRNLGGQRPKNFTNVSISDSYVSGGEIKTKPFSINDAQRLKINYLLGNANFGEPGEVNLMIINTTTQVIEFNQNISQNATIEPAKVFPAGNYQLKIVNNGIPFNTLSVTLSYYNLGDPVDTIEYLGGLRIKTITNVDTDGTQLNKKTYDYGALSVTNKVSDIDYYQVRYGYSGNIVYQIAHRSSRSRFALSNSVSYIDVFEYIGDENENIGYTHYIYHDDQDYGGGIIGTPKQDQSWKRALVKEMSIYNADGKLKRKVSNTYEFIKKFALAGIRAEYVKDHPQAAGLPTNGLDEIRWRIYDYWSEWAKLESTEITEGLVDQTVFSRNVTGTPGAGSATEGDVNTSIHYEYFRENSHINPGKVITADSEGNTWVDVMLYPRDFANDDSVFRSLKQRYFSQPIEQVKYLENSNNEQQIVSGVSNVYDIQGDLVNTYRVETTSPIDSGLFKYNNDNTIPNTLGSYKRSSFYSKDPEVNITYHSDGRIKEVISKSLTISYLWGYKSRYPVAKISNISSNQLETILGSDKSLIENSNDSNFISQKLATLRGNLPSRVFIEVSLYDIGVGVSKKIDPNGIVTSYKYDDFKRLTHIKDQDDNTLEQYEYNYGSNN